MSDFIPTENDLVVNPITGKTILGKNVDSYEGMKLYAHTYRIY